MSRSRKKHPIVKVPVNKKKSKKIAAKRVRKQDDLASGGAFKKVSESWDITDYRVGKKDLLKPDAGHKRKRK